MLLFDRIARFTSGSRLTIRFVRFSIATWRFRLMVPLSTLLNKHLDSFSRPGEKCPTTFFSPLFTSYDRFSSDCQFLVYCSSIFDQTDTLECSSQTFL